MFNKLKILAAGFFLAFLFVSCGSSEQVSEGEKKADSETREETPQQQKDDSAADMEAGTESGTENNDAPSGTEKATYDELVLDKELIALGEETYSSKGCVACHTIGKGKLVGPDLSGVTERRDIDWLRRWMKHPDEMLKDDPIAMEMLKEHMVPMPNQGLSDEEVEALIAYMRNEDLKAN